MFIDLPYFVLKRYVACINYYRHTEAILMTTQIIQFLQCNLYIIPIMPSYPGDYSIEL